MALMVDGDDLTMRLPPVLIVISMLLECWYKVFKHAQPSSAL